MEKIVVTRILGTYDDGDIPINICLEYSSIKDFENDLRNFLQGVIDKTRESEQNYEKIDEFRHQYRKIQQSYQKLISSGKDQTESQKETQKLFEELYKKYPYFTKQYVTGQSPSPYSISETITLGGVDFSSNDFLDHFHNNMFLPEVQTLDEWFENNKGIDPLISD